MEIGDWISVIGLLLAFPIGWLIVIFRRQDAKLDTIKEDAGARTTQLAVIESRLETHEKHVDGQFSAIRDNHAKELTQFYGVVERVEKRLESMEHKVEVGFKEVGDRIFQFLRESSEK